MIDVLLIINTGSSSIKLSIFSYQDPLRLLYRGEIDSLLESPSLTLFDANHNQIIQQYLTTTGSTAGLHAFFDWFKQALNGIRLKAVGHRVVHGGTYFSQPTIVNDDVIKKISLLIPLCPYHLPQSIDAIQTISAMHPNLAQVICFDTSFHRSQDHLATLFAIPRALSDQGLIRYGFHGISYEYIASVITQYIGETGNQRVIVAHLGNGASMCAMYQGKSVASSMGLTALDGLMMGSRCGAIDPGLILYLLQEKNLSPQQISTLLYEQSGLLGVSGISNDMRKLQLSHHPHAIEAIDLFCFTAAKELGALCAILQGCDAIIFTAGIGEHSALIRKKICERLTWLGVSLDNGANDCHSPLISQDISRVIVGIIPTDEELMIAQHVQQIID